MGLEVVSGLVKSVVVIAGLVMVAEVVCGCSDVTNSVIKVCSESAVGSVPGGLVHTLKILHKVVLLGTVIVVHSVVTVCTVVIFCVVVG